MKKKTYEDALEPMQLELVVMARWAKATGHRICVLIEGRDTAGKGGVIKTIAERVNTRQLRTVALSTPTETQKTQWYFQRYVEHLPAAGEIVLFDRSWYNRAGVEKVMGFATEAEVDAFLKAAPVFEKLLVDDGIQLFKYWLSCDQEHQEERFAERLEDPLKRWKLSSVDIEARSRYRDYSKAREIMFDATDTAHAPWTVVDFNDQKRGRLTLIRNLLDRLPDVRLPEEPLVMPPLPNEPRSEEFKRLKPIPSFDVNDD